MNKLTPIAAAVVSLVISGAAGAANMSPPSPNIVDTISKVDVSPKTISLSNGKAMATMTITQIVPPGAVACGIRIVSSDGATNTVGKLDPNVPVQTGTVAFATAGTQTLIVRGQADGAIPACNGSASATVTVLTPEMAAAQNSPAMISLRPIPNGKGAAANEFVEDVPLSVEVNGDKPGSCGYRIIGENLVNHNTVKSPLFTSFGAHEAFTFKGHTKYRVSVVGEKSGNVPACKEHGQLSQDITVRNDRAWINDMTVEGHVFYNYWSHYAAVRFNINSLDVQNGKPCDLEIVRQIGGDKQTYSMHYTGGADLKSQMAALGGVNDGSGNSGAGADLSALPSLTTRATFTVRGVGENACNGHAITKTVSVPLPNWVPVYEGPKTIQ